MKSVFTFFDKLQIVLHFFDKKLKNFNYPLKMLEVFQFFQQNAKKCFFFRTRCVKFFIFSDNIFTGVKFNKLLFTNKINQRADEQQKSSGSSKQNAELIEVPSMVAVVEGCFEASFF